MSQAALIQAIAEMLSANPRYDPVQAIVDGEEKRGFVVVRPGDRDWLPTSDWARDSVASVHGRTVRLVLLQAHKSGKGALTRTLEKIAAEGLTPAIIDPTPELAATLKRRGWRGRQAGRSFETYETVWRPRK